MRFILRRLGFFVLTLWAALTLNFAIPRLMPGNPAEAVIGQFRHVSPQALQALEVELGVNTHENVVVQYFHYLGNSLTGNFGTAGLERGFQPVTTVVGQVLPWTVGLVGVTTILAFLIGTVIGVVTAWRRGGWLDSLLPPIFVITSAFPYFWIGLVLVLFFSYKLGWFPATFAFDNSVPQGWSWQFVGSVLKHAILPALTILITSIGGWILTMRNNMVTTLAEDYVRMARAKGLPPWRIMSHYAARNAILPNLTGFAMSLGFVVSGAILVEKVFNYQGLGFTLIRAVDAEDFPLMQALFLLITVAVLVAILIADIATALLDPRTRAAG